MSNNQKPKITGNLTRKSELKATDNNQIELSFSSEEPYLRSFGYEVLSHEEGAIDLSRLQEIGVVLFNHDTNKVLGKIDKVWIENKRGKALIEFDKDEQSQIIYDKVKAGTLKGVSVGYEVEEWESKESPSDSEEYDTWIAKKWKPYEISIVSIPADASVGVNRSLETTDTVDSHEDVTEVTQENKNKDLKDFILSKKQLNLNNDNSQKETNIIMDNNLNEKEETKVDVSSILKTERSRVADIKAMCRDFDVDDEQFITSGANLDQVRSAILEQLKTRKAPATTSVTEVKDNFRSEAVDSLVMRSGNKVENAPKGANELRAFSLKDLAVECLAREGVKSHDALRRMSPDEVYDELQRDYFNPSSLFPAIMDNAIKKNIVQLYNAVPTTFQTWTTKGSVTDFKETKDHNYLIGGGSFELVGENGELKQSRPSTEILPTRKIDTYGTQFTMTRQAFINDDIGFLSQIPGLYAAAAKRKINQQVYELLFNNMSIYDGNKLFDTKHSNVVSTGSAPSLASINELMLKMQTQKDPFGQAINVVPQMLILPIGHAMTVDTILHSTSITTSESNNTGYNPMAGKGLTYIEDATLNALAGANACPWFMVANAMSAKSVQVDYLNGQEVPTIRRSEKAGQLGFAWDIFLDWGISVIDYRGIAKNTGVKVTI